jgi:mono/diheme cytochrome c family protein
MQRLLGRLTMLVLLTAGAAAQRGRHVLFLVGESEYGAARTIPALAREWEERLGIVAHVRSAAGRELPALDGLEQMDALVLFLRRRDATQEQLARLDAWLAAGGPTLALRTTSHAFEDALDWFPPRFGGHYKGHAPNDAGTRTALAAWELAHPVLRGVPRSLNLARGGTYHAQPLQSGARALVFGRSGELPAQPVAWTFGEHRFYTSLGTREDFEQDGFRLLLANALLWSLGAEVSADGAFGTRPPPTEEARLDLPAPPPLRAPAGALVLFDGAHLDAWRHWDPSTAPPAIRLEARADTSAGAPMPNNASWRVVGRALVARPGFGDALTKDAFGDVHFHADFLLPAAPELPADFRGASGVYVAGRFEVQLAASGGEPLSTTSCGAIGGQLPPLRDACGPPGAWQTLDVTYTQRPGAPAFVSVWLNDVLVQDRVALTEHSPGGFRAPLPGARGADAAARFSTAPGEASRALDFGQESFALSARFRSRRSGTLAAKCPPEGEWAPDAKALFLRGGRLVYDIGWVGALTSERIWNDGRWHTVVLTSDRGLARLYVDGALEGERAGFRADDEAGFVFKTGAANDNFGGAYDGDLGPVRFYADGVTQAQAAALSRGTAAGDVPSFEWQPHGALADSPLPCADDALRGPFRMQADCAEVRFANIWVKPLEEVDHAGLIATWDEVARARGERVYAGICNQCHGADGTKTANPAARPFALGVLENGSDPFSLFRTVSDGFKDMPSHDLLPADERYDVIHYLREAFLRDSNPTQYFAVSDAYLNSLPKGRLRRAPRPDLSVERDFGPALASQLGDDVGACLTIKLDGRTTFAYDLQTLRSPGAWVEGFLDLSRTQHVQQRGEGNPTPEGRVLAGLEGYGFGHEQRLQLPEGARPPRGLLPTDWLDYHGHYVHGDAVVLAYAIDGREVLERPGVDRASGLPALTHRLRIGPGAAPLVLALGRVGEEARVMTSAWPAAAELREARSILAVDGGSPLPAAYVPGGPFVAAALVDGPGSLALQEGHLTLRIEPSREAHEYFIIRALGSSEREWRAFKLLVDSRRAEPPPPSPTTLTVGGPARWEGELVTQGKLGRPLNGYALDTLTLPAENPWNAWLRTSALDFFEDGRAAVCTLGGDVWIVSGIDAELEELRWRRFAAGMFEPLGLRVVDDVVYVTCRDRITRLHDLNGDGEANFYESFFADPDVSTNFHAFNFDLQTDAEGRFYYAKSGQYTDFALPGAVLQVARDGRRHAVWCTGLRTPNGMGMSPDGRPLVSDNQGNWVPASKVSLSRKGGFYGVFKAVDTNTPGNQTRDDFDRPALWMPQSLDSSSGGQLWVDDARFGPLAGRYLHTSFGKGWMYPMWIEQDTEQGGAYRLPLQFAGGIQRLRVNPADGQVYATGLSGWQGPPGGSDGCLQRVRYVGGGLHLLEGRVQRGGVALTFSGDLAAETTALERVKLKRWNYRWARSYGSAHHSLARDGAQGEDAVALMGLQVLSDERTLMVMFEQVPCDQLELELEVLARDGSTFASKVYLTVNVVPER